MNELVDVHALELRARPLTGSTGVEITGVDLGTIDDDGLARLKQLASAWCVVVLRDQRLHPSELSLLGERLGTISYTPGLIQNTDWPNVYKLVNYGKKRAVTEKWHTDGAFSERPAAYSVLMADTLPSAGGDTIFVNQYAAYEALSPAFRKLLQGLHAEHVWKGVAHLRDGEPDPQAIHPLVRTHPLTGRRALYINVLSAMGNIVGMDEAESRALLTFLHDHSIALDRTYRHRWLPGDVLLWDNRCSLHAAAHDYGDEERIMYRIVTEGERPYDEAYGAK
jgi:taurine dioxygenase